MGNSQALTMSYIGSHAGRLLQQSRIKSGINPILQSGGELVIVANGLTSDYNALQVQVRPRLSRGLTALAYSTRSHSIDVGTATFDDGYAHARCAFDVRHALTAPI